MGDKSSQNVSKVEPVDFNLSNDGSSSTTPKAIQHKNFKQTFGKCKRCQKYEIKTMHVQCHHLTCCFTCAKNCKECPQCKLPSDNEKNRHLAVFACYCHPTNTTLSGNNKVETSTCKTDKIDEEQKHGQATDTEPAYRLDNDTCDLILGQEITTGVILQKDERDELYDPNATETLGICHVCFERKATCFIESQGKTADELVCGHDICSVCVIEPALPQCPQCRRAIISFLEVRDFGVNK